MTDQNTDNTKVWLGKPVSFTGITYRNIGVIGGGSFAVKRRHDHGNSYKGRHLI